VDFPIIRVVDIFANTQTAAAIKKDYDYAFADNKYIGAPEMRLHTIDTAAPFEVKGHEIIPINGRHSERFFVTGYRIGPLAYMTDFKELLDGEEEKLQGIDTLVVNALRFREHHSHFNVEEALALINRIKPRVAYLTHMSHEIGLHAETAEKLPEGVFLGYDGLSIEIKE
jgi:phosphoribosyl 1,2-cyclic phosphate phosphodiesterase